MADYQFNTDLTPKIQGPTMVDMVNLARGVQAYQQAEEANPLALQKARMEIEQAQKMNPLAVGKSTEELAQAQIGTKEKQLGFTDKQHQLIFDELGTLKTDPRWLNAAKDKKGAVEALMEREERLKTKGIDHALLRSSSAPMYQLIQQKPELVNQVVDNIINRGGNERQFSQLNQSPTFVNTGAGIVPVFTSPYQGAGPNKTPTLAQSLPPTVATSETGAPMIIGGGKGGGVVQNQGNQQNQPFTPATPTTSPAGKQLVDQFNATGSLQRAPDETYDRYKKRVEAIAIKPEQANNAMNLANRDSIPNQEKTNNQILQLLDKKNLNIGPLANAIANKTGGVGLSDDEQTVVKYLEQRIRMESARSNQDESSQRSAFGSFKNSKEALREIIYNDKGLLASQKLYNQGILKAQGNPNKPNLAAINNFENNFNQLNQDPNLPHLLGVMGNKKMEQLTDSEKNHLNKYFSKMSDDEIRKLFADRDALLNLVRGGK
jgi:hypothetical protein